VVLSQALLSHDRQQGSQIALYCHPIFGILCSCFSSATNNSLPDPQHPDKHPQKGTISGSEADRPDHRVQPMEALQNPGPQCVMHGSGQTGPG